MRLENIVWKWIGNRRIKNILWVLQENGIQKACEKVSGRILVVVEEVEFGGGLMVWVSATRTFMVEGLFSAMSFT